MRSTSIFLCITTIISNFTIFLFFFQIFNFNSFITINKTPLRSTSFCDFWDIMSHQTSPLSSRFFCYLLDIMLRQRSLFPSLITFVTCGAPCKTRDHHSHFPRNPYLGRYDFSRGGQYAKDVPLLTLLPYLEPV